MPKTVAKESLASTTKCRRSGRIANKIKSMAKEKSTFSEERPSSTKEKEKLPYRKKSAAKTRCASSKGQPSSTQKRGKLPYRKSGAKTQPAASKGQSSSTKKRGKLPYRKSVAKTQPATSKDQPSTKESEKPSNSKKSGTKRQPESSDDEESSTEKPTLKKRRVIKMDEIHGRASQMGLQRKQDFSIYIMKILGELSPNLKISKTAIAHMNIYLNYVFKRLAWISAIFLIEKGEVSMTDKAIEKAVLRVVEGEIAKYCIAEGRRAVRKWNEEEECKV